MGYRSQVTIMCEGKAYEMFKKAWESVDFKPDIVKVVKRNKLPSDYIIRWEWVKWYSSFEDVAAIENVCKELNKEEYDVKDGYAYKLIELGEDNATEEQMNDAGMDVLDDFYVSVYVEMPEGEVINI